MYEHPRLLAAFLAVAANGLLLALTAGVGAGELALTLAVLVPVALVILSRPQIGVLALVALLPYDGLLEIIPHPFVAQGWKEALMVFTLVGTFLAPPETRGLAGRRLPSWAPAAFGLFAISVVSAFFVGGLNGLYGLKIGFFWALAFVAMWRCPLGDRDRDRLVTILMVNGVLTAFWGIAQQAIGYRQLHAWGYEYNTVIRFTGGFLRSFSTFTDPFEFGYFVMIVVLVCLPLALSDTRRLRNQLFLLALPVVGLGLLSSTIRGAWLGTAVGLGYLGGTRHRVLLLLIPLAAVSLLFLPKDATETALSASSSQQRANTWTENLHAITAHPLGNGIGTTGAAAGKVEELQGRAVRYFQPDNYYFAIAYELGAIGLWWHLLRLVYTIVAVRVAVAILDGRDAAFASGVGAFAVAAAFVSVIANFFGIYPVDPLWWILVGVVATAAADRELDRARGEPLPALASV